MVQDIRAIEVENLSKTFGTTIALANVQFDVDAAELVALLGANGAGKTTLVRILSTLLLPDSGTARIVGHDVIDSPALVRRLIGVTGQSIATERLLTGSENLQFAANLCHVSRRRAEERIALLLDILDLKDVCHRLVKTYSGGMQRKLDLAMSLIAEPSVLMLDEPTTGLDPSSRLALWDLIHELRSEGTAILLTTQYLEEADRLANRAVVLDDGRVIADMTIDELKDAFARPRFEVRIAEGSPIEPAIEIVAKGTGIQPRVDRTRRLLDAPTPGNSRFLSYLLDEFDKAGIEFAEFGLRRPTLDAAFMALIAERRRPGVTEDPNHRMLIGADGPALSGPAHD